MSISNRDLLLHILDEVNFLLSSTHNKTQQDLVNDPILSRAVIRSLEIIGEATKRIEEPFKAAYPQVEWKKMAGTRDKLIHHYFSVDYEILWDIFEHKLPSLKESIEIILTSSL